MTRAPNIADGKPLVKSYLKAVACTRDTLAFTERAQPQKKPGMWRQPLWARNPPGRSHGLSLECRLPSVPSCASSHTSMHVQP